MPFDSRVYRILIASPSDVSEEREIISQVIQEWNDLHSFEKQVVLLPLKWETHSSPELGSRPQEIINREVVDFCDFAIGVFWTRIGSPTGVSESGTIEEIERVGKANKIVMLYFSRAKVELDEVDLEQYTKLREFKKKTYPQGLIEQYSNIIEFKNKLTKQLEMKVRNIIENDTSRNNRISNIRKEKQNFIIKDDVVEIIKEYLETQNLITKSGNINIEELTRNIETDIKEGVREKPIYDVRGFVGNVKSLINNKGFPDKTVTRIYPNIKLNEFNFDFILESPTHIYILKIKSINKHQDSFYTAGQIKRQVDSITLKDFPSTINAKDKYIQPILIVPSIIKYLGSMSNQIPILKYIIKENTFKNWDTVLTRFIDRKIRAN